MDLTSPPHPESQVVLGASQSLILADPLHYCSPYSPLLPGSLKPKRALENKVYSNAFPQVWGCLETIVSGGLWGV